MLHRSDTLKTGDLAPAFALSSNRGDHQTLEQYHQTWQQAQVAQRNHELEAIAYLTARDNAAKLAYINDRYSRGA